MRLYGFDWDKPGLATLSMISNKTFPYLRHSRLYQGSVASTASQVMLIARCSNLEVLKWNPDSSDDATTPIRNLCRYFEEGNSPNLMPLALLNPRQDNIVADVLRSLDGGALQKLYLPNTEFGTHAHEELKRFFPTLRVLNFIGCHFLLSSNALEIILSCPLLEGLAVYEIHAEDLDPARSWPCHRTLRIPGASFNLGVKLSFDGRTTKSMTTKKELCERVYSTLAHLIQLECLSIDHEYRGVVVEDADYIPLEIDLSKGFGKLAGLKKLEYFQMSTIASLVKPRELYWMLANWPNLNYVIDLPLALMQSWKWQIIFKLYTNYFGLLEITRSCLITISQETNPVLVLDRVNGAGSLDHLENAIGYLFHSRRILKGSLPQLSKTRFVFSILDLCIISCVRSIG